MSGSEKMKNADYLFFSEESNAIPETSKMETDVAPKNEVDSSQTETAPKVRKKKEKKKTARFNMALEPEKLEVITKAADLRQQSVSSLVCFLAYEGAKKILEELGDIENK